MSYTTSLLRWLQRKRYQYEVTFSLLTVAADSFLFLFISMIIIAASLYLPEHIVNMWNRAWFYYAGDDTAVAAAAAKPLGTETDMEGAR
ncbi:MAG: hypothetical protein LQ338_003937 [Usnochroma carphineum]|nr:MAG: hypothetical protein LQ338_003937 [Usnochroma carphineum]